jgi:hypothetical protein
MARLIVDAGWTPARAAEFFNVTWRTADKWARRYRDEGPAGLGDRSSARYTQHAKTPRPVVRKIVHLRWKQRLGPVPIAAKLGMPASTVHAVLTGAGSTGSPTSTGSPENRRVATNVNVPVS